jgi:hypothetical protein
LTWSVTTQFQANYEYVKYERLNELVWKKNCTKTILYSLELENGGSDNVSPPQPTIIQSIQNFNFFSHAQKKCAMKRLSWEQDCIQKRAKYVSTPCTHATWEKEKEKQRMHCAIKHAEKLCANCITLSGVEVKDFWKNERNKYIAPLKVPNLSKSELTYPDSCQTEDNRQQFYSKELEDLNKKRKAVGFILMDFCTIKLTNPSGMLLMEIPLLVLIFSRRMEASRLGHPSVCLIARHPTSSIPITPFTSLVI